MQLGEVPEIPDVVPPLAVDIDGTLTDDQRAVDPRIFPVLRAWNAPVIVATGKAMPYPVALCEFLGIDQTVIAENGGVALVERAGNIQFQGDRESASAVAREYQDQGYDLGWGASDLVNRWRETEIAVSRDSPLEPLEEIAGEYGLEVVDTGFAYHVKSPTVTKGTGLEVITSELGIDPADVVAVGDSRNDIPTFELVGTSIAVANANEPTQRAADHVTDASYADGFLEAIEWVTEAAASE